MNDESQPTWKALLEQAAARCDLDADAFARAAWTAYVDARPGMRAMIEEQRLRAHLEQLRSAGRIGLA